MTAEAKRVDRSERGLWESNVLRNLQLTSEARGLTFYVNPPRDIVPDFLGNYQPDAIARGPEGGIIIEVKHRRSGATERRLAEISKKVSRQKGWELRVVYLNPPPNEMPTIAQPTWRQLQAALQEMRALESGSHHAAAFVTAWAVLEAFARLARTSSEIEGSSAISPLQAVQALAEEGFIENETADRLRNLAKLRNAVFHGDFSVEVRAEQVEELTKELQTIASNIEASTQKS